MQTSANSSAALRAFALLERVVKADAAVSTTELMASTGLPKPTVFRILTLLESAGLLMREPGGKGFTVGPRLARLGRDVMMNSAVRSQRHAILRRLADEIGETCNLTMLQDDVVLYVDRVETPLPLKVDFRPGSTVPLHCTASGKLFLSGMPRPRRRALLEALPLVQHTPRSITRTDLLEAELDRIAASGVSSDNEEYIAGLVCVAVPVMAHDGRIIAALALQAPVARLTLNEAWGHLPALQRAAAAMAETFEPETGVGRDAGDQCLPEQGPRLSRFG